VSRELPRVTIVIPARPEQAEVEAVRAAKSLDYPKDRLEILLARGKQPSVQRNSAMRMAAGELIYFLDDDSLPAPGNLRIAIDHFVDSRVEMVGGPNVCPPSAPALEQVFARTLAAWLAFGPSRARYTPLGRTRETSEKELILCNLVARKASVLDLGGFDETLYPNEENALMDSLQQRGGKLFYDPNFVVERRPRRSLKAFARMLLTYGRGRAEQFRAHPTMGSMLNFVPPVFCLFLLLLPVLGTPGILVLAAYLFVVLLQGLALAIQSKPFCSIAAMPLIVLTHLLYGLGFWRGLFTRLGAPAQATVSEIKVEKVDLG
jgi:hypothetical protein